jgi:uncharacterized protein YbcI
VIEVGGRDARASPYSSMELAEVAHEARSTVEVRFRGALSSSASPALRPRGSERRRAMHQVSEQGSVLLAISNSLVQLHKEQFGRGPTKARSHFAGRDVLVCVLSGALLPAERKLVSMGEHMRVRDARTAFQAATAAEFTAVVEEITYRKVRAFASAVDPDSDVLFEVYLFEPTELEDDDRGMLSPQTSEPPGEDGRAPIGG